MVRISVQIFIDFCVFLGNISNNPPIQAFHLSRKDMK
jgi:hypothetical protein